MEEKVVWVTGPIDSLEVANEIFVNVVSKRLGGPDLVIGGCVEVKDLSASGYNLVIGEDVNNRLGWCQASQVVIGTHILFLNWIDFERGETGADIRWSNPFLAGDCGTGIRSLEWLNSELTRVRNGRESEEKGGQWSKQTSEQAFKGRGRGTQELGVWLDWWSHLPIYTPVK